jgi:Protein of unknown function (DUF3047)
MTQNTGDFVKNWFAVLLIFCAQSVCAQSPTGITFEGDEVGRIPSGWVSENQKNMAKVYSVQAEGEEKFLHADATNLSVQISYERKWDTKDYPILRWRWRAVIFPVGSNEQIKSGNDSVLGLYVVFSGFPSVTAIKYVWSDTLPVGTAFDSPYSSGTKIIVVRSGRALAGTWVTEERNVLSDYEQSFGKEEKHPVARAIAILTDSDNTHSRAVGDYADISMTLSK